MLKMKRPIQVGLMSWRQMLLLIASILLSLIPKNPWIENLRKQAVGLCTGRIIASTVATPIDRRFNQFQDYGLKFYGPRWYDIRRAVTPYQRAMNSIPTNIAPIVVYAVESQINGPTVLMWIYRPMGLYMTMAISSEEIVRWKTKVLNDMKWGEHEK
jgi:hypothetical protein